MINSEIRSLLTEAFSDFNLFEAVDEEEEKEYDGQQQFELSQEGMDDLDSFLDDFSEVEDDGTIEVTDLEAGDETELQQSYIGKVIVDCNVCHGNIYLTPEELDVNEEGLATFEGECPYCLSNEGFTVIGEVQPYDPEGVDEEEIDDAMEGPEDEEEGEFDFDDSELLDSEGEEESNEEPEEEEPEDEDEDKFKESFRRDRRTRLMESANRRRPRRRMNEAQAGGYRGKTRGTGDAYQDYTAAPGTGFIVSSDVDGDICTCTDLYDVRDTIEEFRIEDNKDPERKGMKYSYRPVNESFKEAWGGPAAHGSTSVEDAYYLLDDEYLAPLNPEGNMIPMPDDESAKAGMKLLRQNGFEAGWVPEAETPQKKGYPVIVIGAGFNESFSDSKSMDAVDKLKGEKSLHRRKDNIKEDDAINGESENANQIVGTKTYKENLNPKRGIPQTANQGKPKVSKDAPKGKKKSVKQTAQAKELVEGKKSVPFRTNQIRKGLTESFSKYARLINRAQSPEELDELYNEIFTRPNGLTSDAPMDSMTRDEVASLESRFEKKYNSFGVTFEESLVGLTESVDGYVATAFVDVYNRSFNREVAEVEGAGSTEVEALGELFDQLGAYLYSDDVEEMVSEYGLDSLWEYLYENNGDGADYIYWIKINGQLVFESGDVPELDESFRRPFREDAIPAEPMIDEFAEAEMVAPLSPEKEAEIPIEATMGYDPEEAEFNDMAPDIPEPMDDVEGMPEDGGMEDVPMDDFDEESFNELGESYLKRVYDNVRGFKTTDVRVVNEGFEVEGVISFNSGNKGVTSFTFTEAKKSGNRMVLEGVNNQIASDDKSFILKGRLNGSTLTCESLRFNYNGIAGIARKSLTEGRKNTGVLPISRLLRAYNLSDEFDKNPEKALKYAVELVQESPEISDVDKRDFERGVLHGPASKRYSTFTTYLTGMKVLKV